MICTPWISLKCSNTSASKTRPQDSTCSLLNHLPRNHEQHECPANPELANNTLSFHFEKSWGVAGFRWKAQWIELKFGRQCALIHTVSVPIHQYVKKSILYQNVQGIWPELRCVQNWTPCLFSGILHENLAVFPVSHKNLLIFCYTKPRQDFRFLRLIACKISNDLEVGSSINGQNAAVQAISEIYHVFLGYKDVIRLKSSDAVIQGFKVEFSNFWILEPSKSST